MKELNLFAFTMSNAKSAYCAQSGFKANTYKIYQ